MGLHDEALARRFWAKVNGEGWKATDELVAQMARPVTRGAA